MRITTVKNKLKQYSSEEIAIGYNTYRSSLGMPLVTTATAKRYRSGLTSNFPPADFVNYAKQLAKVKGRANI